MSVRSRVLLLALGLLVGPGASAEPPAAVTVPLTPEMREALPEEDVEAS